MTYRKDKMLRPPSSSSDPGLSFDTWRTPNSDRPTLVLVEVQMEAASATDAEIQIEVDDSGGTTADYSFSRNVSAGLDATLYGNWLVHIPPGGSYQINNQNDPLGLNSIQHVREFTL